LITLGDINSATYAETLSGIEAMMDVLPNNVNNDISARDVRDVVLTLYEEIQGASSSEFFYTDTPATVTVGGLTSGTIFASMSLFTIFNKMFHKDYPPTSGLKFVGLGNTTLDFKGVGSASYSAALQAAGVPNHSVAANSIFDELVSFELEWTATKATYDFDPGGSIDRTPAPVLPEKNPPGNPLFTIGVPAGGGSDQIGPTKPIVNQTNTYTFKCKDDKGNATSSPVSLGYGYRWYWGRVSSTASLTSGQIMGLDGAGLGITTGGSGQFGTNFRRIYTSENGGTPLDPQGNYIAWAWPSAWGGTDPIWNQKAGPSGFATKVQSNFSFVNTYGYSVNYDVWISLETYGSKLDYLQIA